MGVRRARPHRCPVTGREMKLMSPLLLDLRLLSNMAPGTDLSGILETPTMLSADATTRALPASAVMLGLVWEVLTHRVIETNLVYLLAGNQLLDRLRLEMLVQSRDLIRQPIDEHLCRMRFTSGGVRITDSAKCSSRAG